MSHFHITWGTGPGLLAPFFGRLGEAELEGRLQLRLCHRVDELVVEGGRVRGVEGAVLLCTGGIGGNPSLIRENWPERLGPRPEWMLQGVPAHVDGRMLQICQRAGARLVNLDRRWRYPEGIANRASVWPGHGVRLLAGPSSLRLDHRGRRLPAPCFPGFDNLLALETISTGAAGHSWLLLNERVFRRELGSDFAVGSTVPELVAAMNRLTPESPLDPGRVAEEIGLRDRRLPGAAGRIPSWRRSSTPGEGEGLPLQRLFLVGAAGGATLLGPGFPAPRSGWQSSGGASSGQRAGSAT